MNNEKKKHLSNLYDKKYINDRGLTPPEILLRKYPQNRFEAAVKWVSGGGRLLEIGAGRGGIVKALLPRFKECIVTEISKPRVTALDDYFSDNTKVKVLHHDIDSEKLPFSDGYFDVVLLVDVIEHVIDPISVLSEINRVLVNGGKLFIHTPNLAKWTRRLKLLFGFFPSTASMNEGLEQYGTKEPTNLYDEGHLHYFTFRSLSRLLKERSGFREVIKHGYGPLKLFCDLWPALLSDIVLIAVK